MLKKTRAKEWLKNIWTSQGLRGKLVRIVEQLQYFYLLNVLKY